MSYYDQHNREEQNLVKAIMSRVIAWMAGAMAISGLAAYVAMSIPAFQTLPVILLLVFLQLGIVILLSSSILELSYYAAQMLFLTYAMLNGFTLAVVFMAYQVSSIVSVFIASALMFGIMGLYGMYTRSDLTHFGHLFFMGLIGIIISMTINLFLQSSQFDTILAAFGVFLFAGLTAFDMQRIKRMATYLVEQDTLWEKITISCALQLYLDFLNLFMSMLRLTGRRQ